MTTKIVDWMPHWISVTIVKKATETYKLLITTETIDVVGIVQGIMKESH